MNIQANAKATVSVGERLDIRIPDRYRSALDGNLPSAETVGISSGYAQKILFFFCRKCGDYHEKTHPHYKPQKQRSYRRRKAKEAAQPEQHA
jgi:hypothetical protein